VNLDGTLLQVREVLRSEPTEDGLGHRVDLNCGHTVWMAGKPREYVRCGVCLQALVHQIRDLQAQQRIE
jgi:hypothetical protein